MDIHPIHDAQFYYLSVEKIHSLRKYYVMGPFGVWPQSNVILKGFVYTEREKSCKTFKLKKTKKMDVDVATEIMSGIPVRSLLRFKCVSKLWMTLISDPYFSKKHLNHARNDGNSQKILVHICYPRYDEFSLYCSSLSSVQQIEHVQKLDFPCNDKPWRYSLYCCCNGMALMGFCNYLDKHFQHLLWNPFHERINSTSRSINSSKGLFEILALKSGSWRLLDKHPIDVHPMLKSTDSLVCVHGAFHWLIRSLTKYSVMSFSITDDVYREIPFLEQLYSNCLLGTGRFRFGRNVMCLLSYICHF
ncbi:hypothetical protein H5410_035328 [Solanum commersonii]|uniref:F-box domain-containing protein n=1 Tax=Solanum commersonii TaxID=4109 RepID=A0A9J5Y3G8_SOLCO|nr:hypothetical protein H5410_035328 [Solanum commersonii]